MNILSSRTRKMISKASSIVLTFATTIWLSGIATLMPIMPVAVVNATHSHDETPVQSFSFKRNLTVGSRGDDVKELQQVLMDEGFLDLSECCNDTPTKYFGKLTKVALAEFQKEEGISPAVGYFGPITRGVVNDIIEGVAPTSTPTPTPTPTIPVEKPGAPLSVVLDSSSPAAGPIAKGAADVPMTYLKFTAGDADVVISSISVKRGGISADTDISAVKLYEGAAQIGSTQALNTTNSKATFLNLNWSLPAKTSKVLKILANIATSPGVSNQVTMGIDSATDVVGATFIGLPIYGGAKTMATVAVGSLAVAVQSSPSGDVMSGATDQWIGSVKFTSTSEGFNINSLKIFDTGSSLDSDVTNLKLKYVGVQVGPTVASRANKSAAFDLSAAPVNIASGTSKTLDLYGDIASGVGSVRTIIISVDKAADVVAYGTGSGGSVTVTISGTAGTMSIKQGTLVVANDGTNPTAQAFVKGTTANTIQVLKFTAGANEGVRVTQITLNKKASITLADTSISNISLWDGVNQVGTYSPLSSGKVQFGTNTANAFDAAGLFDISASSFKIITVKADIPTGATVTDNSALEISAVTTDVKADGLSSKNDVPSASISGGLLQSATHTLTANGTLAVTLNSASPAAANVSKNQTGIKVGSYDLTAGGENIILTSTTIRAYKGTGTGTVLPTSDINNVKLYDGTTQLGSTVTNPTTGVATFSFSLTIPKNTTKTLSVFLDVPSGTALADGNVLHYDLPGAGTIATDLTSTGVSSGVDIVETGSATGKSFTLKDPTLTLTSAGTPVATTYVINSADVTVYSLNLTAGTAEDVKVSSITFVADDAAISGAASASAADTNWNTFRLYDSTQIGLTKNLTDGTSDSVTFDSLNIVVTKGTTKTLNLKAKALGSATAWYFGLSTAANQVVAVGAASNTSITTTLSTAITSTAQTLTTAGSLTVVVDTSKPSAQNIALGATGKDNIEFSKFRITPSTENFVLKTLTLTRSGTSADSNFKSGGIKLYDGSTLLGTSTLGATTATKATFNFTGSETWQPLFIKDVAKILTIKGDLTGVAAGVTSADAPKLEIAATADLTATGSDSGTDKNADAATTTNNAMTLYKTIIEVSPNSVSPSGLQTAGALKEVLRFNVKADLAGPATINTIKITPNTNIVVATDAGNDVQLFWDLDNYATALQDGDFRTTAGDICTADDSGAGVALTTGIKLTVLSSGQTAATGNVCNTNPLEIAAGATRIFVVKMDTTGAVNPKTLSNDITAIADISWRDGSIATDITTLTKGLPLIGSTLSY